jgi:hypothetical protein
MSNWSRLRLLSAGLLILWGGGEGMQAAKLDPGAWKIYPIHVPLPPTGLTNQIAPPSGTNSVTPKLINVLTNLTDNNPATFVTLTNTGNNAIGLFIDMGQTNVVDRVFLISDQTTNLNIWPNNSTTGTNPPLGLIVISIGNPGSMLKQVGTWTVPYDAGNPVETEVDLRFNPTAGRYVRIQLLTNVVWGVNYWPGYTLASQPPAPANLTWNVGEVELYGFSGQVMNLNAVVCDSFTNGTIDEVSSITQPLQIAALDLSYYLGELTGTPHPIITSSQTNFYSGRIYRVVDLASFAPDWTTMTNNIADGSLPTNPVISLSGREVQFSGWPYRCVMWGVWQFLEDQGIRWVYPDGHGDYVPTGAGVSTNMLPLTIFPSATSIYANFDTTVLQPWGGCVQSLRQGYLYPWRNRWNDSWGLWSGHPLGGTEVPVMPAPGGTVNTNYTEGFDGFPHNLGTVVPWRILDIYTNWWGWTNTSTGSELESAYQPNPTIDDPTLISWVADKMTNIAAVTPLACSYPLNISDRYRAFNLLPDDACTYSQDPYTIASNGPVQMNFVPWVDAYNGPTYSGAYYSFVNAVASQQQPGTLVGALAYADVFAPPANIPAFPSNVWVEVCLYGAPNLPMSAPANAALKSAFDGWYATGAKLATYGYALLHTDAPQPSPQLPVPLVAGTVDQAKYLAGIGALNGGCQANLGSIPYNPWNFYAYPRIRWNTNQTASQLEVEFFNGYFREAAAPMLAYYQGLENYQVTNNISMWYKGYAYGITPCSFPLSVLAAMQANLTAAAKQATNWYVIDRVADMQNGFNWVITNAGLYGINLTNAAPYPTIGSTTNPYSINLTNMVAFSPMLQGGNSATYAPGVWQFWYSGQIQETFNVTTAGTYTMTVTAEGVDVPNYGESVPFWPTMYVYFGPGNGTAYVDTTTNSTYTFTFQVPAGVWDMGIYYNEFGIGSNRYLGISNIQITRQ